FFFQAEDGIRDGHVTGVQTCALPISARTRRLNRSKKSTKGSCSNSAYFMNGHGNATVTEGGSTSNGCADATTRKPGRRCRRSLRSEERRVGKEGRSRMAPDQ